MSRIDEVVACGVPELTGDAVKLLRPSVAVLLVCKRESLTRPKIAVTAGSISV